MKRAELLEFMVERSHNRLELTKRKNADYAGAADDDPFHNFRLCEMLGICSTETGMLVRMCDKLARLATFTKKGSLQVKDESADDTLNDLSNYGDLFAAYMSSKRDDARRAEKEADFETTKPGRMVPRTHSGGQPL